MAAKIPFLSIVIPLYNEQGRLKRLTKIYNFLNNQNFKYEVILINDGSKDNTVAQLNKLLGEFKFKLISYEKNKGKGFAIKTGMLAAKGKFRLFTDTDLSTPIEEFNKFIPYLLKYHIVIGSRKMIGANLKRRQPLVREILGKGFTFLSQHMLKLFISDFTCGFKCFSKRTALEIFNKQKINRWGFDPEILFIGKKGGFTIKEIPVKWNDDPNTKVKFPQDIISSLIDLCKIRYYNFRNLYN